MGPHARKSAGRRKGEGWDILLIDDIEHSEPNRRMIVEECEGTTIITTDSGERAIELLRIAAVDAVYNLRTTCKPQEAEKFRSYMLHHYPDIRVMDLWSHQSRNEEAPQHHVLPLFLQDGVDCKVRRRMLQESTNTYEVLTVKRHSDFETLTGEIPSLINGGHAA